jgi:Mg-chelatase subunit ChlD
VFIQREEAKRLDTAVHVLLDRSGSMEYIQDIANQATVSMAMAVSSIPKCDVAVSTFPGERGHVSPMIARGQPVRPNLCRMDIVSYGNTPLAEAMLYAARELATSNRQRKVLIIITDGEPNNGTAVRYMNDILSPHVDTYAIGICCDSGQDYFNNRSEIKDIKELQSALFDIAGRVLDLN